MMGVEPFDLAVLLRAGLGDLHRAHTLLGEPGRELGRGELLAVVGPDQCGPAVLVEGCSKVVFTRRDPIDRAMSKPTPVRVYSSTTLSSRNARPSWVRNATKS
jgi:hypothetical protein